MRRVPVSTGPPRTVSIILRAARRISAVSISVVTASARWRGASTPSTRRRPRNCTCSMAWRFTKVDSTQAGTRGPSPTRTTRPWFRRGTTADAAGRRAGSWVERQVEKSLIMGLWERPLPFLELDDSGYLGDRDDANCLERVDAVWATTDQGPAGGTCWIPRLPATAKFGAARVLPRSQERRRLRQRWFGDGVMLYPTAVREEARRGGASPRRPRTYVVAWLVTPATPRASGGLPSERREGRRALDRRVANLARGPVRDARGPLCCAAGRVALALHPRPV